MSVYTLSDVALYSYIHVCTQYVESCQCFDWFYVYRFMIQPIKFIVIPLFNGPRKHCAFSENTEETHAHARTNTETNTLRLIRFITYKIKTAVYTHSKERKKDRRRYNLISPEWISDGALSGRKNLSDLFVKQGKETALTKNGNRRERLRSVK